ncbi:short chain dehydrogenase/reductase [Bordetella ansorpii]|uniref:Short chain dehydrogenase/reductase n=1 Tax=Bordetella ansorpii TaxID=288768 RepID=A0A157SML9_9BORD|nr:SDR family NAD(P)-dependent oxidoreductase [Bordetella ansorpii]SAI71652.1 short chain dehydrogenase/reductase [Bordetella ansorpii]
MKQIILITGASSGFGALGARALAAAGHVVYAGMRDTQGRNASQVAALQDHALQHHVALNAIELDVQSEASAQAAVDHIIARQGRLDVLIHNAGHMVFGPSEAFTPEQLARVYDVNVLGTQRVNRAALPHLRRQEQGLVLWVGSSSHRGGTPPYLGPYFAAKAAMDALAVSYAGELARWGVETSILVPGAFTKGTNHFAHSGRPADTEREQAYARQAYAGFEQEVLTGLAACEPRDADVATVAQAMVDIVGSPHGGRPFRVHVDPSDDGCEVVNAVADRVRAEFLRRIGLADLLSPRQAVANQGVTHGR